MKDDRDRLRRISRLRNVYSGKLDAAQVALRVARTRVVAARADLDETDRRIESVETELAEDAAHTTTMADFAEGRTAVQALHNERRAKADVVNAALDSESERHGEAEVALQDDKKIERWEETTREVLRLSDARIERNATDELAARVSGKETN